MTRMHFRSAIYLLSALILALICCSCADDRYAHIPPYRDTNLQSDPDTTAQIPRRHTLIRLANSDGSLAYIGPYSIDTQCELIREHGTSAWSSADSYVSINTGFATTSAGRNGLRWGTHTRYLPPNAGDHWVSGYTRSDGVRVRGHYRTNPDSTTLNNYSGANGDYYRRLNGRR